MSFLFDITEWALGTVAIDEGITSAWVRNQKRAESVHFVRTGVVSKNEENNEIETTIRQGVSDDLTPLTVAYHNAVEGPVAFIAGAEICGDSIVLAIDAVKNDLTQEGSDGLRKYKLDVEQRDNARLHAKAREHEEQGDLSDVETWRQKKRELLFIGGADLAVNSFGFFTGESISGGLIGGMSAAATLAILNVGGGWLVGDTIANWSPQRCVKVLLASTAIMVGVNALAAVFRNGTLFQFDLPTVAVSLIGMMVFAHSLISRLRLPKLTPERLAAYSAVEMTEAACQATYNQSASQMTGSCRVQQSQLIGPRESLEQQNDLMIQNAQSALQFIKDKTAIYERRFGDRCQDGERLLQEGRDFFVKVAGGERPIPPWIEHKASLADWFTGSPVDVEALERKVAALSSQRMAMSKASSEAVMKMDSLLEEAVLAFLNTSLKLSSEPHFMTKKPLEHDLDASRTKGAKL